MVEPEKDPDGLPVKSGLRSFAFRMQYLNRLKASSWGLRIGKLRTDSEMSFFRHIPYEP